MPGNSLRELKDRLGADLRRTKVFGRLGTVFMLFACLALAGGGLIGVLREGGFFAWAGLILFALGAVVYGRQLGIDFGLIMPRRGEAGRPTHVVTVTEQGVSCRSRRGGTESVSWVALRQVVLQAVDRVPVGDVFWLLIGDDGTGCVVPMEAEGADALLENMQHRLPGFDNEAVVAAVGMLEGSVQVWQRDPEPDEDGAGAEGSDGISK